MSKSIVVVIFVFLLLLLSLFLVSHFDFREYWQQIIAYLIGAVTVFGSHQYQNYLDLAQKERDKKANLQNLIESIRQELSALNNL